MNPALTGSPSTVGGRATSGVGIVATGVLAGAGASCASASSLSPSAAAESSAPSCRACSPDFAAGADDVWDESPRSQPTANAPIHATRTVATNTRTDGAMLVAPDIA